MLPTLMRGPITFIQQNYLVLLYLLTRIESCWVRNFLQSVEKNPKRFFMKMLDRNLQCRTREATHVIYDLHHRLHHSRCRAGVRGPHGSYSAALDWRRYR